MALDFLAAAKVHVEVAVHGGDAVRMVRDFDYDLVLMDIAMPGIDGFTATRQIRALGGRDALPIVAMTAHAMAGDRRTEPGGRDERPRDQADRSGSAVQGAAALDRAVAPGASGHGGAGAACRCQPRRSWAEPPLPQVAGVEWDKALASVDYKRERLYKRLRGFVQEYRQSPQVVRDALASGQFDPLQSLVHNLKSSAVYVGANALSALSGTIEQALRAGEDERAQALAPELLKMLEPLLSALAGVEAPPSAPESALGRCGAPDAPPGHAAAGRRCPGRRRAARIAGRAARSRARREAGHGPARGRRT
ncbi:response regulator [Massilia sp. B-10]|nr:response regulator [Massilia sp. B-10]